MLKFGVFLSFVTGCGFPKSGFESRVEGLGIWGLGCRVQVPHMGYGLNLKEGKRRECYREYYMSLSRGILGVFRL